ncbi:probable trehalase isoform X1 [Lycium ferocissimum]|uniref:probable trehalase isoform X1 n=1 Tax=Lycium ferocissimum TaxID=112874 RepID=UPI002814C7FC|nr:probable trehalase isoform X1 [Lycium ferocissimum]
MDNATIFVIFTLFMLFTAMNTIEAETCTYTEKGPVIATTPLVSFLERVQESALQAYGQKGFDAKHFVDMSLRKNLSVTVEAFDKLPRTVNGSILANDLDGFIVNYLRKVDEDLVYVEPVDYVAEPEGFLPNVKNPEVRKWALEVHSLWKNLSRKVSDNVLEKPELYTLLPLKNPVIIAGSRFREVYYWDSYWVIRGLLVSKMYETAKGIVTNLISLIDQYGYVLNGARAYYTNRSQPPVLAGMIVDIYNQTGDLDLVRGSLPALLKEYHFWSSGIHRVTIQDAQGSNHSLSRYYAMWNKPRPEASTIDKKTATKLPNICEKREFYRDLASAAESGWDFSSRWMRNESDLTTTSTTSILPVDLNVFLLKMEIDIVFLANIIGESSVVAQFTEASQNRQRAINCIFWNAEMGQWLDYWLGSSNTSEDIYKWEDLHQNKKSFASNFVPLWTELFRSDKITTQKVVQSLRSSGLLQPAGIAMTLSNTGQQWDFPNGWPPLQHIIIEGLARSGLEEARALAKDIAVRWIRTNYVAYKKTGAMYEKYDVTKCGAAGGGGFYVAQIGFGWANGVVLALLEEFGWPEDLKIDCY